MGGGRSKGTATLNRRGGSASEAWQPLIWAAKDNNLVVAEMLIDKGHDVNRQEPVQDKGLSGYAPVHWAAQKGQAQMVELLLSRGANPSLLDKHNNTVLAVAQKKPFCVLPCCPHSCVCMHVVGRAPAGSRL